MKKKKFIRLLMIPALAVIGWGCNENDQVTLDEPILDDVSMALDNLKILGAAVANSANDPAFRETLYSEVEKQFDGDHNVLFKS